MLFKWLDAPQCYLASERTMWSFFKDLRPVTMKPSVKCRCIRCYEVLTPQRDDISSFECMFHDAEVWPFSMDRNAANTTVDLAQGHGEQKPGNDVPMSTIKAIFDSKECPNTVRRLVAPDDDPFLDSESLTLPLGCPAFLLVLLHPGIIVMPGMVSLRDLQRRGDGCDGDGIFTLKVMRKNTIIKNNRAA